jgi:Flp pilus assembly protein TadB
MIVAGTLVIVIAGLTTLAGIVVGAIAALVLMRAVRHYRRRERLGLELNGASAVSARKPKVPETIGPPAP